MGGDENIKVEEAHIKEREIVSGHDGDEANQDIDDMVQEHGVP